MTLSDILPSLAAASAPRSFPPDIWGPGVVALGLDIAIGETKLSEEISCRPTPFNIDGRAVCRITAMTTFTPTRRHIHVDTAFDIETAIADIAFPGTHLAGARMADVTVVDTRGVKRTLSAELPRNLTVGSPILLAVSHVRHRMRIHPGLRPEAAASSR